ncbi:MAG: glutaredoxin domain-containing protein [Patescibacteria group bacterium]
MKITIYSTPTCTYCKMAKEFLEEHNVLFEEVNVAANIARRKEMIEKSGQMGVPVIDVDGDVMVGYDQTMLASKVGIAV